MPLGRTIHNGSWGSLNFPELYIRALENEKEEGSRRQSSWVSETEWGEEGIQMRGHTRMSHTEQSEQVITHRGIDQRSKYIKVVGAKFLMKKDLINDERTLE